jgi:hypothetical protein
MGTIVLQGVSPEQLFSPEPLERLVAEKTLSYNAGILYGLQAMNARVKDRRVPLHNPKRSVRRCNSGRRRTKI